MNCSSGLVFVVVKSVARLVKAALLLRDASYNGKSCKIRHIQSTQYF